MTTLAMLPAGMIAARQSAPPAALMIAFDCVDQWPLFEPLIAADFGLVAYGEKAAPATPGAYAATVFIRPAVDGAVITADFGAALFAVEPYVRPPVPGAVITADFGANLYGAA